jgi:hypothetical protein|tara:strand:- start:658 stop:819 length:162 start_codon:yes stop_codon:yes gene_type:complete
MCGPEVSEFLSGGQFLGCNLIDHSAFRAFVTPFMQCLELEWLALCHDFDPAVR